MLCLAPSVERTEVAKLVALRAPERPAAAAGRALGSVVSQSRLCGGGGGWH